MPRIFINEIIRKENPLKNIIFHDFLTGYKEKMITKEQINYVKSYIKEKKEDIYPFFINYLNILDELNEYNVPFSDVTNPNNFGFKNSHYAVFDVGYGKQTRFNVDVDEIIDEDEGDYIVRDDIKIYKKTPKELRKKVLKHFNAENAKYLNSGYFGDVFDLGENKLLKITNDANEAQNGKKIVGQKLEYIANIYAIYKIKWEDEPYYVLFIEKIHTKGIPNKVQYYLTELYRVFDFLSYRDLQLDYEETYELLKSKSQKAADFFKSLYYNGHKITYEKYNVDENGTDIDGINLNDLYDISKWVVGSITNDHYHKREVPDYIISLLETL